MNNKKGLLSMGRNWYPWEFQQIVGRPDFQKLHRFCLSETQASLIFQFKVLVRMVFNKIVLKMTDDKVSKFTWFTFTNNFPAFNFMYMINKIIPLNKVTRWVIVLRVDFKLLPEISLLIIIFNMHRLPYQRQVVQYNAV